jgi:hypothetical protein
MHCVNENLTRLRVGTKLGVIVGYKVGDRVYEENRCVSMNQAKNVMEK